MKDNSRPNHPYRCLQPWLTHGLVLLSLLTMLLPAAEAETRLEGLIVQDQLWTEAQSPYRLTGQVQVAAGATVTILPGVVVRFQKGSHLDIAGALIAERTVFDGVADIYNREQLVCHAASRSRLSGCVLQNLELVLRSSRAAVTDSVIANRNGSGITVGKACRPTITRNHFRHNSYFAVYKEGADRLPAPNNYWGADDGPSGAGPGNGDAVNPAVDFMPLATVGTGDHLVLLDKQLAPSPIRPGERLTLTYGIANLNRVAHTVILGATIFRDPFQQIHSPAHDLTVTVEPGYHQFTRSFAVPASLPEDRYTVLWGVMKTDLTAYYALVEDPARLQVAWQGKGRPSPPWAMGGASLKQGLQAAQVHRGLTSRRKEDR